MRFLVFTTLFPNAEMPSHGVFVENRLRAFLKDHPAEVKVIAPVPWFPSTHQAFGDYARWARVPDHETRHGIEIFHPRYFIPPKTAMNYAPKALTRVLRNSVHNLKSQGWDFDFIDAHYFYPDGIAATEVAQELGIPVVVTARGTDINLIPAFERPRQKILRSATSADAVVTVAQALKTEMVRLGATPEKITTLRNGVDLETFCPVDRASVRTEMNIDGPVIASVGHLIDRKGHDLVIKAMKHVPEATLIIAGDGEKRKALEALAISENVSTRVRFLGPIAHDKMRDIYNAADLLVLASSREGWANVLLEAMACGTPCVAADIWGTSEVIREPAAGTLVEQRTPQAFATAINALLNSLPDRAATRTYAEKHSWRDTTNAMAKIFSELTHKAKARQSLKTSPVPLRINNESPKLIVTVDTEERFDWSEFHKIDHSCCDPADIDRFQQLCADKDINPLYFITYPLLKDRASAEYFRELSDSDRATCGLHLHAWVTPSDGSFTGEYYSFQKNYPQHIHREKLVALADAFETTIGHRAISHRAGRYGIAPENYQLLADIGVTHDFSPSAGFDFRGRGGPDFSPMSNTAFVASAEDWKILVTPVCGAKAIQRTEFFISRAHKTPGFALPKADPLAQFSLPMRLSPEGATLGEMQSLTRRLIKDKTPVLTYSLHSTTLTPGANSYAPDEAGVGALLATSGQYFDWFRKEMGGEIISLATLKETYASQTASKHP